MRSSDGLICALHCPWAGLEGAGAVPEIGGMVGDITERWHDNERQRHPPHQEEGSRPSSALGEGSPEHTRVCV